MIKKIDEIARYKSSIIYHVENKPGNTTIYSFFIIRTINNFKFIHDYSILTFPDEIYYSAIANINNMTDDKFQTLLRMYKNVKPHTLFNCINIMKDIVLKGVTNDK